MPNPIPTLEKIRALYKEETGVDIPPPTMHDTFLYYRREIFKLAILALIVEVIAASVLLSQGMLPTGPITGIVYLIGAIFLLLIRVSAE